MQIYDVLVIGGGATGLGVALEAQTRGYKTLLLEAHDFGKGTSSKSTKLIHGGIRYLANLDFALVREGLSERQSFIANAPHLAKAQSYLIPFYSWVDKIKYYLSIKLYYFLSGRHRLGESKFLSKQEVLDQINAPDLSDEGLIGGVIYYDGKFDDTRVLISLLRTFIQYGGVAYNYCKVANILKNDEGVAHVVVAVNQTNHCQERYFAKVIINATGVLTDQILKMSEPDRVHNHVTAAQGTHLVFEKDIFNSSHALVIPRTSDNRLLFVLPWLGKVVVGTTDVVVNNPSIEPIASENEVNFIIDTLQRYTKKLVTHKDIKAKFAGLRPLVRLKHNQSTSKISRKHEIIHSKSNIVSIVGGKWTIYRLMGEDTINYIVKHKLIESRGKSITKQLHLFGYTTLKIDYPFKSYGSDYKQIVEIQKEINNYSKIHHNLPYYQAEIIYHVRYEMAKTVEDILARRTRALFLDANAAMDSAPIVANLMAKELNLDDRWISLQIDRFLNYAKNYI